MIVLGVLVAAAIWGLMYGTRVGLLTRAAVDDRTMLSVLGVNVNRLYTAVFAFGIGLGALGGVRECTQRSGHDATSKRPRSCPRSSWS